MVLLPNSCMQDILLYLCVGLSELPFLSEKPLGGVLGCMGSWPPTRHMPG